jgi:hypothetical protein
MQTNTVVYEEDVEIALAKCVEVLGPIGKYEMGGECKAIWTKEHGKLWYGDLTAEDMEYRVQALAKVLGVEDIYTMEV